MSDTEYLRPLYGDEELSDIRLQDSDGGVVVAVKAVLAARSRVFRKLFFGSLRSTEIFFSEGKDIIIFKEWDCCTLHLLVEFCYTNNISVMKEAPSDHVARVMVNLRSASKAFELHILLDKVNQWISNQVRLFPALACALVDEGMKRDDIDETSLDIIRSKSKAALLPRSSAIGAGVISLTEPALLFVLRTLEGTVSHRLVIDFIKRWTEFSKKDCGENIDHSRENMLRKNFAKKCSIRFVEFPGSNRTMGQNSTDSSLTPQPFLY